MSVVYEIIDDRMRQHHTLSTFQSRVHADHTAVGNIEQCIVLKEKQIYYFADNRPFRQPGDQKTSLKILFNQMYEP
jgi:hypothetical protein